MKFFTKFVICHADGSPYLVRYILFKSNLFSIYLHKPGMLLFRKATHQHIVELHRDANGKELPAWTLVFTCKRIREWGFWTRAGFKHWREYLDEKFGKDNYDTVD